MKKNRVIQFSLVIAIIILFFTTYYSGDKDKIVDANKNSSTENASKLSEEISNIIMRPCLRVLETDFYIVVFTVLLEACHPPSGSV